MKIAFIKFIIVISLIAIAYTIIIFTQPTEPKPTTPPTVETFETVATTATEDTPTAAEPPEIPAETVEDTQTPAEQDDTPKTLEMSVTATAYCPCEICCGKTDGITATGTQATAGRTIAVDPSVIPYGTKVIINGNTYVAEDCGGAIKGNAIDIFFNTHGETVKFGRQTVTAYILK